MSRRLDANLAERFPDHVAVAIGRDSMATPEILLIDELSLDRAPGRGAVCRLIARGS
jgi:ABC-type molybdate transport system ATPase subunit